MFLAVPMSVLALAPRQPRLRVRGWSSSAWQGSGVQCCEEALRVRVQFTLENGGKDPGTWCHRRGGSWHLELWHGLCFFEDVPCGYWRKLLLMDLRYHWKWKYRDPCYHCCRCFVRISVLIWIKSFCLMSRAQGWRPRGLRAPQTKALPVPTVGEYWVQYTIITFRNPQQIYRWSCKAPIFNIPEPSTELNPETAKVLAPHWPNFCRQPELCFLDVGALAFRAVGPSGFVRFRK